MSRTMAWIAPALSCLLASGPASVSTMVLMNEGLASAQTPPNGADLRRAAHCKVDSYRFQRGAGTPVHMVTSADGGYCWTTPHSRGGLGGFQGGATTPPLHGEAIVAPNKDGINRFAYKATPGYVGSDHMIVSLNPGGVSLYFDIDVVSL